MKNVCFVNTTPFWGGGEKWHFENAVEMTARSFNVTFIVNSNGELRKKLFSTKIEVLLANIKNLSFINYFTKKQIGSFLVSKNVDTVIVNDSRDLKTICFVAKEYGIKRVIYRRGIALPPKATALNRFIYSKLVTDIIFNSLETRKQFFTNLDESNIPAQKHLIYNGLEIKEYSQMPKIKDRIIIGNASRLTSQKGLEYLIELAAMLKENSINAEIRIAGNGELEEQLSNEINSKKLNDYIRLVGFYDDVHSFLSELDIYICSSRFEGFGFSIAEAMLHKLPVIGFDISSNPELIKDYENGFLIPPFDVDQLYIKTLELINNSSIREKYGEKGFNTVSSKFDRQKSFDDLEKILKVR